ncbi:TNF receptor-associated factor 5-like isoform X3 [Porites lutea]|uniref:TNF receptor-associated factor 5-like isoform X3 n=1 Tax=Porites lutea TaxID=51062 RepID=UPI003CC5930C
MLTEEVYRHSNWNTLTPYYKLRLIKLLHSVFIGKAPTALSYLTNKPCTAYNFRRSNKAHLEACKFKIVNCTNKNCDATVKRRDLEQHTTNTCEWRIIECEYCEDLNPKKHVELHLLLCRKIPLSCPYSCGISIPREMIQNHIDNDCPLCLVSCPYAKMGCIKKLQRKNVDPHLQSNTREHLDLC